MKTILLTPSDDIQTVINGLEGEATVYLSAGIYRQKTEIRADNVKIIGEDREKTIITFDDYAKKTHADGREYNTFRTYTLCISGNNVSLENLTVENSAKDPVTQGQCVALSVHGKLFRAKNVTLKSTQDTLFLAPFPDDLIIRYSGLTDDETYYDGFIPRNQLYCEGGCLHFFEGCTICGTVDYVFGCAEAYFTRCKFLSLDDGRSNGFVAAPAHSLKQTRGFCFIDCEFLSGGAKEQSVYLARAWRDFGKCEFINCTVGKCINPALFDRWNDTYRDKTARFSFFGIRGGLAPVSWAKALGKDEADEIINYFNTKFKANMR